MYTRAILRNFTLNLNAKETLRKYYGNIKEILRKHKGITNEILWKYKGNTK